MQHIRFTGDIRLVAKRAIEASVNCVVDIKTITDPCDVRIWKGIDVGFLAVDHKNGEYTILHPDTTVYRKPFEWQYPTAYQLCEGVVEILKVMTKEEWCANHRTFN